MDSASPPVPVAVAVGVNNYRQAEDGGIWPNGPVQLARGRQAKNPQAKTVTYSVNSLDDFETKLREYLDSPPEQPEHTECQLSFWIGASFLVAAPAPPASNTQGQHPQRAQHPQHPQPQAAHPRSHVPASQPRPAQAPQAPQAPHGYQPANGLHSQYGAPTHSYQSVADPAITMALSYAPSNTNATPAKERPATASLSVLEALAPTTDTKEKMRKQRAIAKCCIDAIQRVDGFRYSFHNCWNSREDQSYRFSYYCNDSLLNKDRAANGKGAKLGKRATKPVYDCKGVLSVKFSATKKTLDVFYKHVPVHATYEARAPPPRRDSRRRKYLEDHDPEALIRIANRPHPPKPSADKPPDAEAPPKPRKKKPKKEADQKVATTSIENEIMMHSIRSLLALNPEMDRDPAPQPPVETNEPHKENDGSVVAEQPAQQALPQSQPQQPQGKRPRPRNSCDICKAKKTKCDGTRPICKTCSEKGRQCFFSEPPLDDHRQSLPNIPQALPHSETAHPIDSAIDAASELERTRRELEEARALIAQLQAEKTQGTPTPLQTPQVPQSRSHSQPQPLPQPPTQLQSPPQPPPQQQQIHNPQQLQAPQLQTPQLQTTQYSHFTNHSALPSYTVDRTAPQTSQAQGVHQMLGYKNTPQASQTQAAHQIMEFNKTAPQAPHTGATHALMEYKNASQAAQTQGTHQMQTGSTGLTPTQDTSSPYRADFNWQNPQFYGFGAAPQQDQWQSARYR